MENPNDLELDELQAEGDEPPPADAAPDDGQDDAVMLEAASPLLLEHRDFVYERYLGLPIDL